MNIINRFSNALKALRNVPFQTGSGGDLYFGQNFELWDRFWSDNPASIDYVKECGDLRDSGIVMAGVEWVGRNLNSARPQVITLDADQKEVEIADHALPQLLKRPNEYCSFADLCYGIAYSWITYATAYILKERNGSGLVAELWWEPHQTIRPAWPDNGSEFISHYELQRHGKWFRIEKEDVIVLRKGLDPITRCGMSATAALLREYYTDKQAGRFMAQLVKNGLVPPAVVALGDKDTVPLSDTALAKLRDAIMSRMSGKDAGKPLIVDGPVTVEKLGFDYSSVGMRDVRQVPQMAFCAAMGISPTSLYFDTSRQESTYSNVEMFLKHDYRSYIVPLHDYFAQRLTWDLLPDFDSDLSHSVTWDYSQVAIMQPDQNEMATTAVTLFEKNVLKRSEAREMIGYKWDEEDEVYASEAKPEPVAPVVDPLAPDYSPATLGALAKAVSEITISDTEQVQ